MSLAQFFRLSCVECKWYIKLCTSKECCRTRPTSGRKGYDIKRRTIRKNGRGYAGMNIFCCWMNMPLPMAEITFHHINSCVHNAYVKTSHESMKVSNDNNQTSSSDIANTKVSGDGEWQKRGYSSLNGVVTLSANGKRIDNEVMSKKCKQ